MTAAHIFRLLTLGAYTGNHFFRVDKGFVAQVGVPRPLVALAAMYCSACLPWAFGNLSGALMHM